MHLVVLTQVLDRRDAVLGFFHGWCAEFARHTEQLTVIAQRVGDVDLPANVVPVSLGRERGAGKLSMLAALHRALRRLRGPSRPDAVLAHMVPKFVLYALPQTRVRKIPMFLWYTHKGVDRSLRMAAPWVEKVFTASGESFRLETDKTEVVVTGHGVDARHFYFARAPRTVDVVAVGRIAPTKGQEELLAALERLPSCPRTAIAGDILLDRDASYRDELVASARTRFGDRVEFLGAVPWLDVAARMRASRVLVNTSRTGSVDKVVLEAMCCGTLPLTCNEAFAGVFGADLAARLMYTPGDVEDLSSKLAALLALDAHDAEHLGRRLRTKVLVDHDVADLAPRLLSAMGGKRWR